MYPRRVEYYQKHSLGSIFIPKISLSLPVFDTTTDSLLYKGITLLPGSSYPVGGKSTHTVLMGHSGLPNQELFTHLHELKKGDKFFESVWETFSLSSYSNQSSFTNRSK